MSIFRKPINKVLGDPVRREIKRYEGVVALINDLEADMSALSDEELKDKTREFRERLGVEGADISHGQPFAAGLTEETEEAAFARAEEEQRDLERARALDELLPEAFAVVREASRRTLGMRHFDVQLIGGIVLHQGRIAEMKTGEGKTLVATLALYLNALEGRGAHLVTVNDYLARRDAGWNAALYDFLGMSVGVIAGQDLSFVYDPTYTDDTHPDPRLQHLRPCSRREAYATDITYSTNNELGFDYLRDNMAQKLDRCVQRRLHYAIVDEVDSILVDEARTPLIISGQASEPTDKFYTYARLIPRLVAEDDYTIDEKTKSATLTEEGVEKIEKWTGLSNVYDMEHVAEAHQINQALRAHALWHRDKDYIVRDGEVIIVDEFTGRTMPGRRWSDGLHQAVEAKEGVTVREENQTVASITFQNYFRLYAKLSGMTGTADTEAFEFQEIYGLEVAVIPTHKPMIRKDRSDLVFLTEHDKFQAIAEDIQDCVKRGQPVLVGTTSIETSERLAKQLAAAQIAHEVLNAKQHEREAHIVAEAGRPGAVTIATNMAGRGTDIVLGGSPQMQIDAISNPTESQLKQIQDDWRQRHELVIAAGGLHIVGTERHESRRIDNQLRGRSGRQGDPGSSRFYLSLEDNLMRIFGDPTRMKALMTRVGMKAGEAIESGMLTRQIERAQRRVEQHNFDARKQLLEYDDVANDQRRVIYRQRTDLMSAEDVAEAVVGIREEVVETMVDQFVPGGTAEDQWDAGGLAEAIERDFGPKLPIEAWLRAEESGDGSSLKKKILEALELAYREKVDSVGAEVMRYIEKEVMLRTLDQHWREHLAAMDYMRQGIYLRGYAQKDPKQEYKREAFGLFSAMLDRIKLDTVTTVSKIQVRSQEEIEREELERQRRLARALQLQHAEAISPIQGGVGADHALRGEGSTEADARAAAPAAMPFVRPVPKVGRNEPCPCGSGRKYKHCHGALQQASG